MKSIIIFVVGLAIGAFGISPAWNFIGKGVAAFDRGVQQARAAASR